MKGRRRTCFQNGIKLLLDEQKLVRLIHRVPQGRLLAHPRIAVFCPAPMAPEVNGTPVI